MKKLFEAELEDFHESSRAGWKRCSRKTSVLVCVKHKQAKKRRATSPPDDDLKYS